jgi:hypothetical protein
VERGDIASRVQGNLRLCVGKTDKKCVLSNMHIRPAKGNFKEGGKYVKSLVIEDRDVHPGYADLNDRMSSSYNISRGTWKWLK